MNHFEVHLIVLSREVDSKILRLTIKLITLEGEKSKMMKVMFKTLDGFLLLEFWCSQTKYMGSFYVVNILFCFHTCIFCVYIL